MTHANILIDSHNTNPSLRGEALKKHVGKNIEKDLNTLVGLVKREIKKWGNPAVVGYSRFIITEASSNLIQAYKDCQDEIDAEIIVVRGPEDEGLAAKARNANGFKTHTLFIFSEAHFASSYFTGTCTTINVPEALQNRIARWELSV